MHPLSIYTFKDIKGGIERSAKANRYEPNYSELKTAPFESFLH